jgi:ATP-binding cassette subfamily B protein
MATYVNSPTKVGDYLSKPSIEEAITVDFAYYENPFIDTLHLAATSGIQRRTK